VQHSTRAVRRRPGLLLAAGLVSIGLLAAACGGDDDDDGGADTTAPATTAGGGTDTTTAGGTDTTSAPDTTAAPETPTPGGKLTMGIEAETGSPWRPAEATFAISGHMVAQSVYDPLMRGDDEGKVEPFLAESVEPNADYTVWTIKAREGVSFHDGTPFDGAAIKDNLDRHIASFLTGKVLRDVESVTVTDPMTVEVKMKRPWVPFNTYLAGTIGYMASPAWLAASDADETLKPKPVGTGPFVFKDYKPGESFSATKNPNYWLEGYPLLDEIEFRVYQDALTRKSALEAGDIDLMHTTNGETIAEYRESGQFPMVEITERGETGYTLLHVTQEGSPLTDSRVRCAMAYAYPNQDVIDEVGAGVNQIANGPFSPGQLGNVASNSYPLEPDMDKAKELVESWKADNPGVPLVVDLSTTQDQTNLVIAQIQQQAFKEAGFDDVKISQIEQAKYILTALQGSFQAFQWRNHGGADLDNQYIWWHSSSADPVGQLALNFGRIKDADIDRLLDENRGASDPARKKEIAEEVNEIFATQCYNLWGSYTTWGVPAQENVRGIGVMTMPSGNDAGFGVGIAGTFPVAGLWIQQ
jgi:peptide/nickel transport system substrate-binding protein